jgi:hypothetical protein
MAANNIRILKHGYTVQRFRTILNVELGIEAGDGILGATQTGTNYASLCLTGDPEQATDMFAGVSKSASTATASADGVIDVELVGPGTIIEGTVSTPGNTDTDAKILLLLNDFVTFDRSAATAAGTLTVDEDEGTDFDVHGLMMLDFNITNGKVYFTPTNATLWRGLV